MSGAAATPFKFDLKELYIALDEKRRELGISWAEASRQISAVGPSIGIRRIASSTVTTLHNKSVAEGDGVLQMLRWLGRSPESFVVGCPDTLCSRSSLPNAASHEVLRFDTRKLYEALDHKRKEQQLTWKQIADKVGMTVSQARSLAKGGRTAFPGVVRLTLWLDQPVARFVRRSPY